MCDKKPLTIRVAAFIAWYMYDKLNDKRRRDKDERITDF